MPGVATAAPAPVRWCVPREWAGERCFIVCGGESVRTQKKAIAKLRGRIIAVKQSVLLRPDADVMFIAGKDDAVVCRDLFPVFRGTYLVARRWHADYPAHLKALTRTKVADRLCEDPHALAGLDAGSSAINLAFHFGATEIILLGFDMCGGRWFNGEIPHHLPKPPQSHFDRHMAAVAPMAADLKARGVRVVNCSPTSVVTCFERQPLEAFL